MWVKRIVSVPETVTELLDHLLLSRTSVEIQRVVVQFTFLLEHSRILSVTCLNGRRFSQTRIRWIATDD